MNKFLGMFILLLLSSSCSSNLDFNQVNNLKLTPIVVANFATFDVPANQFLIGGVEQSVTGDVLNFDIFRNSFFNKSLIKADLYFEINNTINRAYIINLYFLDVNNSPLYRINFNVPAYNGVVNLVTKPVPFENNNIALLKNTWKIGFTVTMLPGTALNNGSLGSLKLSSSATAYLVIQ